MASLNVDSLFTNITNSLFNNNENNYKISNDIFRNLLNVATKELLFMLNKNFYKQIDIAILRPVHLSSFQLILTNTFMCCFENKWLNDCSVLYSANDILITCFYCLFPSIMQKKFKKYLSFNHQNMLVIFFKYLNIF